MSVSHYATVKAVLTEIEGKRDRTRFRRELTEEVRDVLAILDDLENGNCTRREAHERAQKLGLLNGKPWRERGDKNEG